MKTQLLKLGLFVLTLTIMSTNRLLAFTAVADGNWTDAATWGGTAPTGNVSNQDIVIPSGIEVNLDIDVIFSGLLNNFTVDGTLSSDNDSELSIQSGAFSGSGDVDIEGIAFSGLLTTYSHTGDLMVGTFVNMGSILTITSQVSVSDTLNLDGGSLTLGTGSNLTLDSNSMIIRNDGTLATSGGIFNSGPGYHVRYIGGTKTTGIEINSLSLQDAEISLDDNTTTLTLGSDLTTHGNLKLNMGILNVAANDLSIEGDFNQQTGTALTTIATSNVMIETSTALSSGLTFTAGSSVDQFMIDYSGSGLVELNSPLAISGELQLSEGTLSLENGSTLTMNTGSMVQVMNGSLESNGGTFVGTASYDVNYMGDATTTTGIELTGTGLNDVEVNIVTGEVTMDDDVTVDGQLKLSSGKLHLNAHDLILNGTLDQDTDSPIIGSEDSDLQLNITTVGDDTLYFDGADQNVDQLVVNLTGGNLVLGSMLHVHDELTMTSGSIKLLNDNLVIEQNADITGYSNTKYIMTPMNGKLQMYVTLSMPYTVFPVGTETNYSPASIQVTTGSDDGNFMVKAFDGMFTGGTEGTGFNSAVNGSIVNRTWLLETDAAPLNMNLKLGWMPTSEVNGFDRTHAFISHFMNGSWDSQSSTNAATGANGTYEVTRTGVTSLSPFAVVDEDANLSVDDETAMLDLNLYPNPCTDLVNIDYANAEGNQYVYEVTDITGRVYDVISNGTNQMDVSALSKGTYLLRMTNVTTNKSAVKQFIKR